MTSIHRSALVEYSAYQMFDLVNDIEKYPEFMLGCVEAAVISGSDEQVVGKLRLSKAGVSHEFTTKNLLNRPQSKWSWWKENLKLLTLGGLLTVLLSKLAKFPCPWSLSSIPSLLTLPLKNY